MKEKYGMAWPAGVAFVAYLALPYVAPQWPEGWEVALSFMFGYIAALVYSGVTEPRRGR